ncbi:hypothetical protein [Streptomyces sp. NPDC002845]
MPRRAVTFVPAASLSVFTLLVHASTTHGARLIQRPCGAGANQWFQRSAVRLVVTAINASN